MTGFPGLQQQLEQVVGGAEVSDATTEDWGQCLHDHCAMCNKLFDGHMVPRSISAPMWCLPCFGDKEAVTLSGDSLPDDSLRGDSLRGDSDNDFVAERGDAATHCHMCNKLFDDRRPRSTFVPIWCRQCEGFNSGDSFFSSDIDQSTTHKIRIFDSQLSPLHIGVRRRGKKSSKLAKQKEVALMAGQIMKSMPQDKVDIVMGLFFNRPLFCGRVARAVAKRFKKQARDARRRETMPCFDTDGFE